MRDTIPYLIAFIPLFILSFIFSYLGYRRMAKKYVRIFKRTLINNGVPRNVASKLSSQIKILGIGEILKYKNFRNFG